MPEFSTQQLLDDIGHAVAPAEFDHAAQSALSIFDELNDDLIAQGEVTLACRAGCSLCCSLRVEVFAHEIFLMARHISAHFTAEQMANLRARLDAHAATVLTLTPYEHATRNLPCALLLPDGRCGVYAVRPQSCRRHHSRDFATCQFTFDHPTDLDSPAAHDRDLYRGLTEAMLQNIEAYAELGFDHTIYELGTALREALRDSEAWPRWENRGQAFLEASVTPAE